MQPVATYQPFAELARGAAVVYKAYDRAGQRTVLLKVLTPEAAEDPALVAWFEDEARAVAAVEHPNVVALYEAGRHAGRPFLAAEFVEGRSLADVLAEGALPPELAAYVAAEAARGLAAAHARGLLHRDVKPSNVLLAADGQVKLADFGLATRVDAEGDGMADAAGVRGTPGYLAPEVVRGARPGPAADLFALGAVLAEALTGRPAFPSADAASALDAALHHDPVPALAADPRVPAPFADAAARLLAKAPAARLASAAEAAAALDAHRTLPGRPAPAGAADLAAFLDDPAAYRAARPAPPPEAAAREGAPAPVPAVQRVRIARTLVAAGVLAAVVVTALGLWPSREEPAPAAPLGPEVAGGVTLTVPPPTDALPAGSTDLPPAAPPPLLAPPDPSPATTSAAPVEEPRPEPPVRETPPRPDPPAPEPVEPVPPAPGALVVAVEPWAEVTVDGRRVGTTPLGSPLALPAGPHRVVLRNPEFPEHVVMVEVAPGATERLAVSLWALVARVTLEVSPWAEVTVDGQAWGTVPPQRRPLVLAPGTHAIRFVHPTLGTHVETLTVAAGEVRTLRVRMDRPSGAGDAPR